MLIPFGLELPGPFGALLRGGVAVALEHESGGTPDVDFRDHVRKLWALASIRTLARLRTRMAASWQQF
jgi:hypothetical protein